MTNLASRSDSSILPSAGRPALLVILLPLVFAGSCDVLYSFKPNPNFCTAEDPTCPPGRECTVATNSCDPLGAECSRDSDCDELLPVCGSDAPGRCGPCAVGDDSVCAANHADDGFAACGPDGACVQCLDSAQCDAGACNVNEFTCVGCVDHGDCDSEVCDVVAQDCIAEQAIIYVDGDMGMDPNPDCGTQAMPCRTIPQGLALVMAGRKHVRVRPRMSNMPYTESLTINALDVEIVAPNVVISRALNANEAGILVTGAANVAIDGPTIQQANGNGSADGIRCAGNGTDNPTLALRRVTIAQNADVGIQALECELVVTRSHVANNLNGGIDLISSSFDINNSWIYRNGKDNSTFGGIRMTSPRGTQILQFNTIANNDAPMMVPSGVICDRGFSAIGNIVYLGDAGGEPSVSTLCTFSFSNIQDIPEANNNTAADPGFVNAMEDEYHLTSGSALIDFVGLTTSVVPVERAGLDIDGQLRPVPKNGLYDIGADEFKPE